MAPFIVDLPIKNVDFPVLCWFTSGYPNGFGMFWALMGLEWLGF
jgi:hypothetical protein